MSENVKSLHPYLRIAADNCYDCPFAFLISLEPFSGVQEWQCTPARKPLGAERSTTSAPEWCPIRHQPIVVHWKGKRLRLPKVGQ